MQLTLDTFKPCTASAAAAPRRSRVSAVVRAQQSDAVSRRSALAGLAALPALLAAAPALAFGKDPRQAAKDKEARREKLRETAEKMKTSQKSEAAFEDSKYSMPEGATTPNMRGVRE